MVHGNAGSMRQESAAFFMSAADRSLRIDDMMSGFIHLLFKFYVLTFHSTFIGLK